MTDYDRDGWLDSVDKAKRLALLSTSETLIAYHMERIFADHDTGEVVGFSQEEYSEEFGFSRNTVNVTFKKLKGLGFIQTTMEFAGIPLIFNLVPPTLAALKVSSDSTGDQLDDAEVLELTAT